MDNLKKFEGFLLEKTEKNTGAEIKREAKKIASQMFDKVKSPKFDEGSTPKWIEFEITKADYGLDYGSELKMDYSEGVLKKRTFQVSLKFSSKHSDEKPEKYFIKFNIKLKETKEIKFEKTDNWLVWSFEKKPNKVLRYFSRSLKIKSSSDVQWSKKSDNYGTLQIKKSFYDKHEPSHIKNLIDEEGGEKMRNKKITD